MDLFGWQEGNNQHLTQVLDENFRFPLDLLGELPPLTTLGHLGKKTFPGVSESATWDESQESVLVAAAVV